VTLKLNVGTGKAGYTRIRDHLTRNRPYPRNVYSTRTRPVTDPYPTRGYGSGTANPVSTGIPTDL